MFRPAETLWHMSPGADALPRTHLTPAPQAYLAAGLRIVTTLGRVAPDAKSPWEVHAQGLRTVLGARAPRRLLFARQVHGTRVVTVGAGEGDALIPDCDGLVTTAADTGVVVRTADCLPLVLWSGSGSVIGVLHAGWRGAHGGILGEGLAAFQALGVPPAQVHLWIGPGICGGCYEVSVELAGEVADRWGEPSRYLDGRRLDLAALVELQASRAGIPAGSVNGGEDCTFCGGTEFPSHRRDGTARGTLMTVVFRPQEACAPTGDPLLIAQQ